MRHGRLITTALAAFAAMAITPAWAAAAPASFADDSAADFAAGTAGLGVSVVAPGSVRLAPEDFNGSSLPASLTATPSGVTVAGGSVNVDGGRVSGGLYSPGQVLTFRATFFTETYEQVGFADAFADGQPWAMFSFDGTGLSARTTHAGPADDMTTPLPATDPTGPHNYRIEWSATQVKYYVDDFSAPVVTHAVAIAAQMRPIISDPGADGNHVSVDSLGLSSGTFESRVHDLGEAPAAWRALSTTVDQPSATQAIIETRSGATPTPDAAWSAYQPLGAGNAIPSPLARYLQYRVTLSTTDALVTPSLDSIGLDYSAPGASIAGVQVSGTTATISFSTFAQDLARFECSVDGGAFAPCSSPTQLTGLAVGGHTISVRGVDNAGNTGDADTRSFTIDRPATGVGTGAAQQPSGGSSSTADKTAPKVTVVARSSRVSKKGTVSFRVACPKAETSCKVTVQLKRGSTTAARKTVTVKGGKTVTVTLQLTKAVRSQLTKHSTLKMSTVVTARDAAGNRKTTTRALTLRAPSA